MKKYSKYILDVKQAKELSNPIVINLIEIDKAIKEACDKGFNLVFVSIDSKYLTDISKILRELGYTFKFNPEGGHSGKNLEIIWDL